MDHRTALSLSPRVPQSQPQAHLKIVSTTTNNNNNIFPFNSISSTSSPSHSVANSADQLVHGSPLLASPISDDNDCDPDGPVPVPQKPLPSPQHSLPQMPQQQQQQQQPPSTALYKGLRSEDKLRRALPNALSCPITATRFAYSYVVERVVGFGSNGAVLAARPLYDLNLPPPPHINRVRLVAIKIIYKTAQSIAHVPPPHEISVLEALSHPSSPSAQSRLVLKMFDAWQDDFHHYMVCEFVGTMWYDTPVRPIAFRSSIQGMPAFLPVSTGSTDLWAWSYAKRLEAFKLKKHTMLPLAAVKSIAKQTAYALHLVHTAGYYHGDVKSENIICQENPASADIPQIILADFGHSRPTSVKMKYYGTFDVAPPEFLADSPYCADFVDGTCADVFALGIVIYTLVSRNGEVPDLMKTMREGNVGFWELFACLGGSLPISRHVEGRSEHQGNGLDAAFWNLIDGMCMVDPRERLSMLQVVKHPWLC
ncbi:hypothetical protein HDU84_007051 [Entophlyctis sp. JEL0112]|nr:hypothetical protein HDU84_007051 [Entophlyctis sp. JEL0112]